MRSATTGRVWTRATVFAALTALIALGGVSPAAASTSNPHTAPPPLSLPPTSGQLAHIHSYQPVGSYSPKAPPPTQPTSRLLANSSTTQFIYADANWSGASNGANVEMDIANPFLANADAHSLGELAVQSGDGTQIVEVGWTVDRSLGSGPRLFVFHWVDGTPTCYNGCGFVQVSSSTTAGQALPVGAHDSFAIEHFQGNWWAYFNGTWFGYFPDSLWSNRYTASGLIQMFGEVAAASTSPCTDMGTGLYATDPASASMNVAVLGNSIPATFGTFATNSTLYSVQSTGNASIRYGGPGGC